MPLSGGWLIFLALALACGVFLRLVWPQDMEYKTDEAWTFRHAQDGQLRWVGMNSSVHMSNPGMSLWVFTALRALSGAQDPPALVRTVQMANCLALLLLVAFAFRCVRAEEREVWLWAAALVAVNPLVVLFHRKLWPPCILPLFTLAMLWGWWFRGRRVPAFLWGLVGACLGQIHMSGFFFAGGFALWAFLFDRRSVAWKAWLVGSLLGALPLLPWASYVLAHPSTHPENAGRWLHALEGKFWLRWCLEPFGLGIEYTLGPYFREFLAYPRVAGHATYLVAAAHGLLALLAMIVLGSTALRLWRQRGQLRHSLVGRDSATAFTQSAAVWGFGILLTLSAVSIHRHYMIVLFPLEFVWLARLVLHRPRTARWGRGLLAGSWAAQLVISASFLGYVHDTQRIDFEYGATYAAQRADLQK